MNCHFQLLTVFSIVGLCTISVMHMQSVALKENEFWWQMFCNNLLN